MDISQLAIDSESRLNDIDNAILALQARRNTEQGIYDELVRLSSQPNFTIEDINFLISVSQ